MRLTWAEAAQTLGLNRTTVWRYLRTGRIKAQDGKVLLSDVERVAKEANPKKAGRKPYKLASPFSPYIGVNDQGQLCLSKFRILAWDASGKVIQLRGTPRQKGCFTASSPSDTERASRFLELRILTHMVILAKGGLQHSDWDSAVLPATFSTLHEPCMALDLFRTPQRVTPEGYAEIVPRPRDGCYVETTRDHHSKLLRASVVKNGEELGCLLPLAHRLDKTLAHEPADRIRLLTALFIEDMLKVLRPRSHLWGTRKAGHQRS